MSHNWHGTTGPDRLSDETRTGGEELKINGYFDIQQRWEQSYDFLHAGDVVTASPANV